MEMGDEAARASGTRRHPGRAQPAVADLLGLCAAGFALAAAHPYFAGVERKQALCLAVPIDAGVDGFIRLVTPLTDWLRWFLITWVLIPLRDGFLWLPFSAVLAFIAALGWLVGGARSALICLAFNLPIALSGWWDRAMITVYTVTVAVTIALLIGLPLGIWAAARPNRARRFLLLCDTLQTFPSFMYLIPVVMLFGVNDVAVVAEVMVFATVPILRFTIEGLVLGLAVAFMGLMADHLLTGWAARRRKQQDDPRPWPAFSARATASLMTNRFI